MERIRRREEREREREQEKREREKRMRVERDRDRERYVLFLLELFNCQVLCSLYFFSDIALYFPEKDWCSRAHWQQYCQTLGALL